jgi:predicted RNase H-like nuclease (RuvC/YqgF family)
MNNLYPKPRWDLENDVLRLEQMIIVYEQEIEQLKTEKEELQQEVLFLRRQLEGEQDEEVF